MATESTASAVVHARRNTSEVPPGFTPVSTGSSGPHDALWQCGAIARLPFGGLRRCTVTLRKDRTVAHHGRGPHDYSTPQADHPGFPDRLRERLPEPTPKQVLNTTRDLIADLAGKLVFAVNAVISPYFRAFCGRCDGTGRGLEQTSSRGGPLCHTSILAACYNERTAPKARTRRFRGMFSHYSKEH
jgi:hypothetical protein